MNPWVELIDREYLSDFIPAGGAAVKFLCGAPEHASDLSAELDSLAETRGLIRADLDASSTKLHRIDAVFFQIARAVDWSRLADLYLAEGFRARGWHVSPAAHGFDTELIARAHAVPESDVRDALREWLRALYDDFSMCHEFRLAMIQLCRARIAGLDNHMPAVLEWLQGDLRRISEVKGAKIFQKIGRHNARLMLQSAAQWLRRNGRPGLLVTLDIARCLDNARPAARAEGFYYSSAALTEVYEMLRQLIDSSADMPGAFVAVFAPPAFLIDEKRGVDRYQALKMRIFDDARNRGAQNLLAPLIRLGELRLMEAA